MLCLHTTWGSSIYNDTEGNNVIDMFENYVFEMFSFYPVIDFILAGDFNARCGELQDIIIDDTVEFIFDEDVVYDTNEFQMRRVSKDKTCNNFGLSLINVCQLYGILIVNGRLFDDTLGEITCVTNDGSSVVNYFIVSSKLFPFVSHFEVGSRTESVHFPLHATFSFNGANQTEDTDTCINSDKSQIKYTWKEECKDTFIDNFTLLFHDRKYDILDMININIDTCVNKIVELNQASAECLKANINIGRTLLLKRWWDAKCKQLKRAKLNAFRMLRRNGTDKNLTKYKSSRNEFKKVCKRKQSELQRQNRQTLIESRSDNNIFWKTIKRFRSKPKQTNDISSSRWLSHFKELLYNQHKTNVQDTNFDFHEDGPFNDYFNAPFSLSELRENIKNLKLGKAGGPNGLIAEMIKHTANQIVHILLPLFNKILELGWFPKNWSESIRCLIFKAGSLLDPNNYRGVSLIDILNKILTGMMHTRLNKRAEQYSKIDESQAGFRSGYSTTDNIFTLMSMVQKYLSETGDVSIAFSLTFPRRLILLITQS